MKRVRLAATVRRGIGERLDDLQLLDDRAGPAVCDDERKRVLMPRADVDEVDVQPVDLGQEVRQAVQPGLALAPVVVRPPVAGELLHGRERHALRVVVDRLRLGPPGRVDAPTQLIDIRRRKADLELADVGAAARGDLRCRHGLLLRSYARGCSPVPRRIAPVKPLAGPRVNGAANVPPVGPLWMLARPTVTGIPRTG